MDFIKITNGRYLHDYVLELTFNTGETKQIDLQNELWGDVFEPLKDKNLFKSFFITHRTIEWENGADFAPEFLYETAEPVKNFNS